ncbi:MAG TPA: SDR family NAD(P)-dependent oxidoreductase [Syntrophorhabdales bacterium]|nr:SDR family NAD(P)-dependent oxidoreductase [Syntrophorhabdales bacterium]
MGVLDGKICVITGGAGSLGLASASLFLSEGAKVMLVDSNEESLARAVDSIKAHNDTVDSTKADVSSFQETQNYINRTVARWGKIDVLFSNAGHSGTTSPITNYPEDIFDTVMAVNVRGSFLACKYGLPQMKDGGSIIITSSIMGVTSSPNSCAYVTSKHALVGLMRTVAKEVAVRRIRVNVLAPGPIDNAFQTEIERRISAVTGQDGTAMINARIPLGRHARPEEIARLALFLASDQSSFSTGSIFLADGGMNA